MHVPLRAKSLSEKNSTEDSGNENLDKIVLANQFEQKVKNLRVEVEKRSRRGAKPFTRKGRIFSLFLVVCNIYGFREFIHCRGYFVKLPKILLLSFDLVSFH